ncbi:MAG: tRNA pseudouridine(55) synthase TruB [Flavobacteriales bacterium]|nr:tRNA pseudouridine(55) synthase TruB [Flavobacteriia bacterium]NCP06990.1 tRNA pseudouridine(55) synthase TruB [Flavobacteriales bacterium]PIV94588.1 MAG: tRNA pseudouridine(55) synthase TruB [Flavobacteriaceae bacterium CG17_big_fil_post_rev_8_21_14_2_50_33_15]PIY13432.1 MAG: tRNA pseudouridine(55) synthase TruB [Flavobacteriaceae bacterium CG_4_10_14_3_um_filter_33_47]PJB18729.1 MAG: tRNA pseudouridine(55) synthase TruB [Flavobacteriaceae bacterium CG_4_9_14_3_um_filter_33_16]
MLNAEDYLSGQVLLIDKPLHWTSFQVVNKLRYELKKSFKLKNIKVGHAGTLDPLATGLLVICTGKMTKQIDSFQGQIKEYTGTLVLGSTTPSYDLETAIDKTFQTHHITTQLIQETTSQFIGDIQQIPPIFSALKQNGKRLYQFARAGEEVNIKSRQVTIHAFEITNIDTLNIDFRIVCSKGTYIRSLVHDFGKALKSGAHLSALRRTGIGDFNVSKAKSVEYFLKSLPSE